MPPSQPNEQEIQFRKRARRRLVGAVALVLLMITVLPMLLDDHAARTPQEEIVISIPSQDKDDFTSKVVPLDDKHTAQAGTDGTPIGSDPAALLTDAAPVTAKAPEASSQPGGKEPALPAASEQYVVQIGVFSDAGNVQQLQKKLQDQGYQSYTEKIATSQGEKIRLRAGPFATRTDAERALEKIKGSGLSGMVMSSK